MFFMEEMTPDGEPAKTQSKILIHHRYIRSRLELVSSYRRHGRHHGNNPAFDQSNEDVFLDHRFALKYLLYDFLTYRYGYEGFGCLHFASP